MKHAREGAPREGGRLRLLDLLRFGAAMSVVLFHYTGRDSPVWGESVRSVFPTLSRFTVYGGYGPYVFFMISGFVVLMSAWGRSPSAFLASRVGRLYPAYWVAVVGTAVVLYCSRDFLPTWDALHLPGVLINLTMMQSAFGVGHLDGVYWTLWVELLFYLLLVGMTLIGITRQRMLLLCLVWPPAAALAGQFHSEVAVGLLQPNYAPFFCIGILLHLAYREGWSGGIALLLGMNYLFALWISSSYYIPWSLSVAGAPVSFRGLALLLTASIAAIAAATMTRLARVDWRWLSTLGALTYPLYLVHEFPGWVLMHHLTALLPAYVVVATAVAVMLVVAHLVHRFVEQPLGPRLRSAVQRELAGLRHGDRAGERATVRGGATVRPVLRDRLVLPELTAATAEMPALRPEDLAGPRAAAVVR